MKSEPAPWWSVIPGVGPNGVLYIDTPPNPRARNAPRARPVRVTLRCDSCGRTLPSEYKLHPGVQIADPSITCVCPTGKLAWKGKLEVVSILGILATMAREGTPLELQEIQRTLTELKTDPSVDVEDLARAVEATGTPIGDRLGAWIRSQGGGTQIVMLIIALISLITMLLQEPGATPEQIEQIFEQMEERIDQELQEEPGRNDPCPCGRGKKFKACHGAPAPLLEQQREQRRRQAGPPPSVGGDS